MHQLGRAMVSAERQVNTVDQVSLDLVRPHLRDLRRARLAETLFRSSSHSVWPAVAVLSAGLRTFDGDALVVDPGGLKERLAPDHALHVAGGDGGAGAPLELSGAVGDHLGLIGLGGAVTGQDGDVAEAGDTALLDGEVDDACTGRVERAAGVGAADGDDIGA